MSRMRLATIASASLVAAALTVPLTAATSSAAPQATGADSSHEDQHESHVLRMPWQEKYDDLRQQGITYAKMGVSFIAWYDIIAIYRELVRRRVVELAAKDHDRAARISDGLNRTIDIAMSHLGEAYLAAKEAIIAQQQAAIRELSLPVLQVSEDLLVIPLIGVIDSQRARQLIESLLTAIRERRARGAVIDVTGVPIVDTAVANHLVQAVDAARLMGAIVAITGISPEMAQTLVALGAQLPDASTHIDLQEGIEEIERLLEAGPT